MTVSITSVGVGTTPGDGTGDTARVGGQTINTNFTNVKTAIEALEGRFWTLDNTARSLALGERVKSSVHAGITHTLPATFAQSATALSDIWVWNPDTDSNITLAPTTGDQIYVNGTGQGISTSITILPGHIAICSVRTTDSEWDVTVLVPQEHTHTATDVTDFDTAVAANSAVAANTAKVTNATHTGDVTGDTALTIATNIVSDAKFRQSTALTVVGRSANSTGDVADIAAGTDGHVLRRSGTTLGFGQIAIGAIPDALITLAKMADVATGTVFYRKTAATGVPEVQTLATLKTDLGLTGTNSGDEAAASDTVTGIVELATVAETNTGTDTTRAVTPAAIAGFTGTANIATVGTITSGTWNGSVIAEAYLQNQSGTNTGDEAAASATVAGIVELATIGETNTGTDSTRAVTPDGLDGWTGSAQITTVGTIGSGTWAGSVIAEAYLQNQSGTNTGDEVSATTSVEGVAEIATQAEVDAGTDTTRYVTPDTLEAATTTGAKQYIGQNLQTGTTYTLVIGDAGKIIEMNNASANTLTIPANSSVAFPVNTRIDVVQYGAGQTTIAITTDTLRGQVKVSSRYNMVSLWKRASTEWIVVGGIA